jgi:hypothetical protein
MATIGSMSIYFLTEIIFSATPTEIDEVGCDGLYVKEIKHHQISGSQNKKLSKYSNEFYVDVDYNGAIPL